jgi:hypothetical protein
MLIFIYAYIGKSCGESVSVSINPLIADNWASGDPEYSGSPEAQLSAISGFILTPTESPFIIRKFIYTYVYIVLNYIHACSYLYIDIFIHKFVHLCLDLHSCMCRKEFGWISIYNTKWKYSFEKITYIYVYIVSKYIHIHTSTYIYLCIYLYIKVYSHFTFINKI